MEPSTRRTKFRDSSRSKQQSRRPLTHAGDKTNADRSYSTTGVARQTTWSASSSKRTRKSKKRCEERPKNMSPTGKPSTRPARIS